MKRIALLAIPALFGGALVGCTDSQEALSPDFGHAVRANIAAQVVNPDPAEGLADTDGRRIQAAVRRYQTNRTYQPQPALTSLGFQDAAPASPAPEPPASPSQP